MEPPAPPPTYPSDEAWSRLSGNNRYETMSRLVADGWDHSDTAIVATGDNFPDALAAAGLAGILDGGIPVILTSGTRLSTEAANLLDDLNVKKVYIVGGTPAVSASTQTAIASHVSEVQRISGPTRIETALEIYRAGANNWGDTAIIACSTNYPDALSISPFAFAEKAPIFLADPTTGLTSATVSAIKSGGFSQIIIVGSEVAVPSLVKVQLGYAWNNSSFFTRLGGTDRFETSSLIVNYAATTSDALGFNNISIASGNNFPDALAGGPLAGKKGGTLLLVSDTPSGRASINTIIAPHKQEIGKGYIFGDSSVVSESLARAFRQASLD
jgi:putative cell wall-binding protein